MANDLLTDVLRHNGSLIRRMALAAIQPGQALQFPCERSVGLHVVLAGPLYVHGLDAAAPICLASGDLVLMARGTDHVLSRSAVLGEARDYLPIQQALEPVRPDEPAQLLTGAYQFWHQPLHPFFAEMPPYYLLRAQQISQLPALAMVCEQLVAELRSAQPASGIVAYNLLDLVFAYVLRQVVAEQGVARVSWCKGAHDPQISQVMRLLQDSLAHAWTLDELARRVGLSRTRLAERFRQLTGDTPLNFLRTLRMQQAMRLLADTSHPLERVAAEVGYQDAFGFSKVFKRTIGVSPRTFRQQDAAERESLYRFGQS